MRDKPLVEFPNIFMLLIVERALWHNNEYDVEK